MSFVAAVESLNALGLELAPGAARRKFDLAHMRTLAAAGYRTGLYTSPHLERVTERIRLAEPGDPFIEIRDEAFARLYFQVDETGRRLVAEGRLPYPPSYFETLTALAFLYFAGGRAGGSFGTPVDIAILEVGLGGRLDATNIVEPVLSVITDIALDHQEYLGPTIAAIAREKAGILRPGGTLVTLPQHPEANQAIGEVAQQIANENAVGVHAINAAQYLPGRDFHSEGYTFTHAGGAAGFSPRGARPFLEGALAPGLPQMSLSFRPNHYNLSLDGETLHIRSPLVGEHQQRNIALAIAAAAELRTGISYKSKPGSENSNLVSYNITNSSIESGISSTAWPGRLEFLPPNLLLDVAHNPAGAWTLRAALASLPESQPRTLLFSCLRDKNLREMAQILFPLFDSTAGRPLDHIVLTPVDSPRAAPLDELLAAARALDVPAHPAAHPAEALALARRLTPPGGLIVATGSIYLVGAIRGLVGAVRALDAEKERC